MPPRRLLGALALCAACAWAPSTRADSRIQLDLGVAQQIERFQSRASDSLGLTHSIGTVGLVAMDFTVLQMAVGPQPVSLHTRFQASSNERVFVSAPGGPGSPELTLRAPQFELRGGVMLGIPMGLVDGTRGARLDLGYEGGIVVTRDTGDNFLQISRFVVGFERVGGALDGSGLWVDLGHNDLYGPSHASGRWGVRTLIQSALFGAPPTTAPSAKAGAPPPPSHAPVRVFVLLSLETDGRDGPDSIGARAGILFDPWEAIARAGSGPKKK